MIKLKVLILRNSWIIWGAQGSHKRSLCGRGRRTKVKERDGTIEAKIGVGDFEGGGGAVTQGLQKPLKPGRDEDTDFSLRASRRKTARLAP